MMHGQKNIKLWPNEWPQLIGDYYVIRLKS